MPFTISHAAAVLPLRKLAGSRLPLAAMMIGSMSPDFAYFLPQDSGRASSHDFEGILLFCWPVSLALWLLFVHLLERPTIELLPAAWRTRVPRSDPTLSASALAFASLAVIMGAMTHVAWDAFTHFGTPITERFPAFNVVLFTFHGHSMPVYLFLQYLCSVIGLLALARWAFNLRRLPPRARHIETRSTLSDAMRIGAAALVVIASGATALLSYASNSGTRFEYRVFRLLIDGMLGWAVAWCVVALFVTWRVRAASVKA